jgi:hypothetical protein
VLCSRPLRGSVSLERGFLEGPPHETEARAPPRVPAWTPGFDRVRVRTGADIAHHGLVRRALTDVPAGSVRSPREAAREWLRRALHLRRSSPKTDKPCGVSSFCPDQPARSGPSASVKHSANSFTEGQAKQHILNSGYTSVSALTKGSDGVWRGTATKGGQSINVALDFKGNVAKEGASSQ